MLAGGMNGRQVADQAIVRHPDLKILFMYGHAKNAIVEQSRLAPGVRLISKPFVPSELRQRIRDILDET